MQAIAQETIDSKVIDYQPIRVKQKPTYNSSVDEVNTAIESITQNDDYDPTDSAQYKPVLKILSNDGAKEGLETTFKSPTKSEDHSYIGSGVKKQYIEDEEQTKERSNKPRLEKNATPKEGGEIAQRKLSEAVTNTGERLDPETEEWFKRWLWSPEGQVWRAFYESTAPIRSRDYNFAMFN
jgi:hypothetical protein